MHGAVVFVIALTRSVSLLLKTVVYSTGAYSAHAFPFGEGGPP